MACTAARPQQAPRACRRPSGATDARRGRDGLLRAEATCNAASRVAASSNTQRETSTRATTPPPSPPARTQREREDPLPVHRRRGLARTQHYNMAGRMLICLILVLLAVCGCTDAWGHSTRWQNIPQPRLLRSMPAFRSTTPRPLLRQPRDPTASSQAAVTLPAECERCFHCNPSRVGIPSRSCLPQLYCIGVSRKKRRTRVRMVIIGGHSQNCCIVQHRTKNSNTATARAARIAPRQGSVPPSLCAWPQQLPRVVHYIPLS